MTKPYQIWKYTVKSPSLKQDVIVTKIERLMDQNTGSEIDPNTCRNLVFDKSS